MELKGKIACEISRAEELAFNGECFSGVFKEANVEELVSLLSCFMWRLLMEISRVFGGRNGGREEVLQHLIVAAKSKGETQLEAKLEEAVSKSKRDIVFAASLYLLWPFCLFLAACYYLHQRSQEFCLYHHSFVFLMIL